MSNIKALDELRDYSHLDDDKWTLETGEIIHMYGSKPNDPNAINWGEQWRKIADEIEQEIAERYIELPVDAEGVPIRIGDVLDLDGDVFTVRVIRLDDYDWHGGWMVTGLGSQVCGDACECRHVKPRTIEDVIADALHNYAVTDMSRDEVCAKYAEEIRGMMA